MRWSNKRVVCVVHTMFQLLGLLCIFSDKENRSYKECDILIDVSVPNSESIVNNLNEEHLFNSVSTFQACYPGKHANVRYFRDSILMSSRSYARFKKSFPFGGKIYDILLCGSPTPFALDVRRYCVSEGETIFFDDGTGSHNGAVFNLTTCLDRVLPFEREKKQLGSLFWFKELLRYVAGKNGRFNIVELWLFSIANSTQDLYRNVPVLKIPKPSDPEFLNRIFDYSDKELIQSNYIYLTLPNNYANDPAEAEKELITVVNTLLSGKLVIKPHPQRSLNDLQDLSLISKNASWELLVMNGVISSESILLGSCSSAQIHPKTLFGVEPKLIFLFNLLPFSNSERLYCKETVATVRNEYKDPNSVYCPSTVEELTIILDFLQSRTASI